MNENERNAQSDKARGALQASKLTQCVKRLVDITHLYQIAFLITVITEMFSVLI